MNSWYAEYWAQTWYRNTFLVRRPDQIAQAIGHDREWNNLHDSGCNFTCLAMIIGIDPARLASALCSDRFFYADNRFPARNLAGKTVGLVWDQNAPYDSPNVFVLRRLWHQKLLRRVTATVAFVREVSTTSHERGKEFIRSARKRGHHVICGPEDHAHLVAGQIANDFFLWNPDEAATPVEKTLAGGLTLKRLFNAADPEPIEFLEYRCDFD